MECFYKTWKFISESDLNYKPEKKDVFATGSTDEVYMRSIFAGQTLFPKEEAAIESFNQYIGEHHLQLESSFFNF